MTKLTGSRILAATPAIAGIAVLSFSLSTGAVPMRAFDERNGQLRIVKDCSTFTPIPGSAYCTVVSSNLDVLPVGTRIYYDQVTAGPSAGPGYLDSNTFIYVKTGQWAVGRCTIANDNLTAGLCTISNGSGALAGFSARIVVTYKPGGDGALYAWDGTYSFDSDK